MSTKPVAKEYYRQIGELQAVDFVLVELTLYLDTHPDDQKVIAQFNQFQQRKQALMKKFEGTFGPLQEFGNSPTDANWSWAAAPWPWQV